MPSLKTARAKTLYNKFSNLSIILAHNGELALHDDARGYLFRQWLEKGDADKFASASSRLFEYFDNHVVKGSGVALEIAEYNRMFHLFGINQSEGFSEFQRLFRQMRHQYRLSECKTLINLVHEYDSVLESIHAVWLFYQEGKLNFDLRHWKQAEQLFNNVLSNNDAPLELISKAYNRLGFISEKQRDWNMAIDYFQKALELAKRLKNPHDLIYRLLNNLGAVYRDSGKLGKSESLLNKSIELAKKNNDPSALAVSYNSIATLYRELGDPKKAVNMYAESFNYLKQEGDKFRLAQVYNNLGMTYADLCHWNKSEEYFRKSLDIKREAGDTIGQAMTLNNMARVYQNLNLTHRAIEVSNQAIGLFGQMKDSYNIAQVKRNLGKLYRRAQEFELAKKSLTEALEIFESSLELQDAKTTKNELDALNKKKTRLPWWALIAVIIVSLFIILGIVWMFLVIVDA
jgi:tetratricopeptide (TPR) repeat protein